MGTSEIVVPVLPFIGFRVEDLADITNMPKAVAAGPSEIVCPVLPFIGVRVEDLAETTNMPKAVAKLIYEWLLPAAPTPVQWEALPGRCFLGIPN
jgi:hypothetical protein